MTGSIGSNPNFDLRQMLGFEVGSTPYLAESLYTEFLQRVEGNEETAIDISWLNHGHPLGDLESKEGLSLIGRGFMPQFHTGRLDPLTSLSTFLDSLKKNKSVLENFSLDAEMIANMEIALRESFGIGDRISRLIDKVRASVEKEQLAQIRELSTELAAELKDKKILWVPVFNKDGLALMLRLDAENGISIINAGVDERHPGIKQTRIDPITGKTIEEFRNRQFITYEARKKERIGDASFFESLIKGIALYSWDEANNSPVEKIVYEALPRYIQGKETGSFESNTELYKKNARNDDESFKNVSAAMYYMCCDPFYGTSSGEKNEQKILQYKKIKFLWESQILISFCRNTQWKSLNGNVLRFLADVLHNSARSAEKLAKKGGLSPKQLSAIGLSFAAIEKRISLEITVRNRQAPLLHSAIPYAERAVPQAFVIPPNPFVSYMENEDENPIAPEVAKLSFVEEFVANLTAEAPLDFSDSAQALLQLEGWVQRLDASVAAVRLNPNFSRRGDHYVPSIHEQNGAIRTLVKTFADLVSTLPVPLAGDDFWSRLPEGESRRYLELVDQLSNLLIPLSSGKLSPDSILMVHALHVILLKIGTRLPDVALPEKNFYSFDLVKKVTSPDFQIKHSGLQKITHDVLRYLNPEWTIETTDITLAHPEIHQNFLFAFSTYPSTQAEFTADLKNQDATTTYLLQLLQNSERLADVKQLITVKNLKLEAEHETKLHQFQQKVDQWNAEKKGIDQRIATITKEIEDLEKRLSDERERLFKDFDTNTRTILEQYIARKSELLTRWHIIYGADREIEQLRQKLTTISDADLEDIFENSKSSLLLLLAEMKVKTSDRLVRLSEKRRHLAKEPTEKPIHPGQYPVDSKSDQLAALLTLPEGRALLPPALNTILNSCLRSRVSHEDMTEVGFDFYCNWNPIPLTDKNKERPTPFKYTIKASRLPRNRILNLNLPEPKPFPLPEYSNSTYAYKLLFNQELAPYRISQNSAMMRTSPLFGLSQGEERELYMLGLDPYDTANRVAAFFKHHITLLEDPYVRKLIRMHLFRPERLHSQFRDNPEAVKALSSFIESGIQHFREVNKIEECLYLVRLGHEVKGIAERMECGDVFPDFRELLLEKILPNLKKHSERFKIYRTLVLMHEHLDQIRGVSEEQRQKIVQDILAMETSGRFLTEEQRLSGEDAAILESILLRYAPALKEPLSDEAINHAVKSVLPDFAGDSWEAKGSQYTCASCSYNSVTHAVILPDGRPLVTAPGWILNNTALSEVYPYPINQCVQIDAYTYVLNNEVWVKSYSWGHSLQIARLIEGTLCRYMPVPQVWSEALPTIFKEGVQCWIDDQGQKVFLLKNEEKIVEITLENHQITEMKRLSDGWIWEDFNRHKERFTEFSPLEKDLNQIECWRNPLTQDCMVAFGRLGIDIIFKESSEALNCRQFPGFTIAKKVFLKSLAHSLSPYLALQNEAGERKALVPYSEETPVTWLEFSVMESSPGVFDIVSDDVKLQLFQMLLCTEGKNYGQIKNMLDKMNSLSRFTDEEKEMILKIKAGLEVDRHPEANALWLKVYLLNEENSLKFPPSKNIKKPDLDPKLNKIDCLQLFKKYQYYVTHRGDLGVHQLSENMERQVLEMLYNKAKRLSEIKAPDAPDAVEEKSLFLKVRRWLENKVSDEKSKLMLGVVERELGDRFKALSTVQGPLGSRTVRRLDVEKSEDLLNFVQFPNRQSLDFLQESKLKEIFIGEKGDRLLSIPDEEEITRCLDILVKEDSYWEDQFTILYYIAVSGKEEQREVLGKILDLTSHQKSPCRKLIKWVFTKPGRYPSFHSLNEVILKWKIEAPKKFKEASSIYEKARNDVAIAQFNLAALNQQLEDVLYLRTYHRDYLEEGIFTRLLSFIGFKKPEIEKEISAIELLISQETDDRERAFLNDTFDELKKRLPKIAALNQQIHVKQRLLSDAKKAEVAAGKSLKAAEENVQNMNIKFNEIITEILPGFFYKLIHRLVLPIFKSIRRIWNLRNEGLKFLGGHIYAVRDIFAEKTHGKKGGKLEVDKEFLQKTDDCFNRYFSGLRDQYFKVFDEHFDPKTQEEWDPVNGDQKNVTVKLKQEKAALDVYRENYYKKKIARVSINKGFSLETLRNALTVTLGNLNTSIVAEKKALLDLINQSSTLEAMHRLGQKQKLDWEDVRRLTLAGNLEAFTKETGLDQPQAKRLMEGVADYLVKATRLEQMKLAIAMVKKGESAPLERQEIYLKNIIAALEMRRVHAPDPSKMSRLWFEYANMYMYRDMQIEKIEALSGEELAEVLAEMPTGFGKTKALVPSFNYEKGQKGLILNIHPKTIEALNSEDVKGQMAKSFGRKADRFHFDRSTDFTVASLRKLYEEMQVDYEEGRPINLSSESLRSLELHFILTLHQYEKANEVGSTDLAAATEEIGYFIRILRAIRVEGWATIDEAHVTLDPNDKLIYTIGDSKILPAAHLDLMEEIFDQLTPEDDAYGIRDNLQSKLAENDDAWIEVADKLADYFAEKLDIDVEREEEFKDFILGNIEEIPHWIKKDHRREKIALIKGELSYVLRSSLKGHVDENFGLSKLHFDKKQYAVSYSSSNTPKENEHNPSQFKNPHETMNKTYLTYLHKGLKVEQVKALIKSLQKEQLEEAKESGSFAEAEANKMFQKIYPKGDKVLSLLNDSDIEELFPHFQHNKKAIFHYIKHMIAPQLKLFPHHLVSTSQNFRSQFASSVSLTATPQHAATHGPDTRMVEMEGTSGQVIHLLLNKVNKAKKLHIVDVEQPKDVLERVLAVLSKNAHLKALIDVGALLRGLSNEEVALALRRHFHDQPEVRAIQYFDVAQEKFVVMEVETGQLHDPMVVNIDPSKILTFYDQPRCFGSDLKQAVDASGLLLVGNKTTKAVVGQGAGRMRQWHLDQGMEVLCTESTKKEILENQHLDENAELSIKHLLKHWTSNQGREEAEKNYRAQLEQMDNEIRRTLLDLLMGLEPGVHPKIKDKVPDVGNVLRLFKTFQKELLDDDSFDPWKLYASMPKEKPTLEILQAYHKGCLKRVKKLDALSSAQRQVVEVRLSKYPSKWEGKDAIPLPEKVKATGPGLGMECEVLQDTEQKQEVDVQEIPREHFEMRTPSKWPESLDIFRAGWEKPVWQSVFLNRIKNVFSRLEPKHPIAKLATRFVLVIAGSTLASVALIVASVAVPIVALVATGMACVGLGLSLWSHFSSGVVDLNNCTYKVADLMGSHLPADLKKVERFFPDNLLVSNNFYVQKTSHWREMAQVPFTQEQKPLYDILVIQDGESLQVMMIDQNDSIYFRRKLQKDYEKTNDLQAAERTRKIAVYDIQHDMIAVQGKNAFGENELEENEEFRKLLVQVKLINGETFGGNSEAHITQRETLAEIVGEEKELMARFVKDHVLAKKPITKARFDRSPLGQMLKV